MSEEVKLFPAWKQAVKTLIDGGLDYGHRISKAEIERMCDIVPPRDIDDVQRYQLEVLQATGEIKDTLLTAHSMLLRSDQSGGYVVIHPRDQTRVVVEAGIKAITKEMRRMATGTTFIRQELLTDVERARNADAQAKISRLADMMNPTKSELIAIATGDADGSTT
jgi:hypothetical protein